MLTIAGPSEGSYTVKRSRFLSFARPVDSVEEARAAVKEVANRYCDARHVCWAYILGENGETFQSNDNGEPSGTAGRPILGQIRSAGLSGVVVIVVRYFGGILLGTPGLISAYREAARLALSAAQIIERVPLDILELRFPYSATEAVMRLVKTPSVTILQFTSDNLCHLRLQLPRSLSANLCTQLRKIPTLEILDKE